MILTLLTLLVAARVVETQMERSQNPTNDPLCFVNYVLILKFSNYCGSTHLSFNFCFVPGYCSVTGQ